MPLNLFAEPTVLGIATRGNCLEALKNIMSKACSGAVPRTCSLVVPVIENCAIGKNRKAKIAMLPEIIPATMFLFSTVAMAEQVSVDFRCEGNMQRDDEAATQLEPFSIRIQNKVVKIDGLSHLDTKFTLIQMDDKFCVFKNAMKTQGGNIERPTGVLYLYAIDKVAHKVTLSVNGHCTKEN
jgi:hypothetical protein